MRSRTLIALTCAIALACGAAKMSAASSEQVIFSGTFPAPGPTGPGGFWIWCEADSANPYVTFCNGAMYFYAQGIVEHVFGTIAEPTDGHYVMTVSGNTLVCTLSNPHAAVRGPRNEVDVSCNAGSGLSTNAVVNVTGP